MNTTDNITVRLADHDDIPATSRLLERHHAKTLQDDQRANGFVTTELSVEDFGRLIDSEKGVTIAVDESKDDVIGMLAGASWEFLSAWPMFKHMAEILDQYTFDGKPLDVKTTYEYGPICIDEEYRGQGLGEKLIEFQRREFSQRYPVMVTFISTKNPRSYRFHTRSGFEEVGTFEFNDNEYWLMAMKTQD